MSGNLATPVRHLNATAHRAQAALSYWSVEFDGPFNQQTNDDSAGIVTQKCKYRWGRKGLIVAGMWIQAGALLLTALSGEFNWWLVGSVLPGLEAAMVYPSLIAAVSNASNPAWRARSLGVYRFWRDLGYAIGALSVGFTADAFGFQAAILTVAALTF